MEPSKTQHDQDQTNTQETQNRRTPTGIKFHNNDSGSVRV